MGTKKKIKIAIVDNNIYYNKLISRQLQNNIGILPRHFEYSVNSFIDVNTFLESLNEKTHFIILDYYFHNGMKVKDLLDKIKLNNKNCKIILMSRVKNKFTAVDSLIHGAHYFIHKDDKYAFIRTFYTLGAWINEEIKNIS